MKAPVLRGRVAKYVLWKARREVESQRLGLPRGGQHDNEYVLRGMMWADTNCLFYDNRERYDMVNDIHH